MPDTPPAPRPAPRPVPRLSRLHMKALVSAVLLGVLASTVLPRFAAALARLGAPLSGFSALWLRGAPLAWLPCVACVALTVTTLRQQRRGGPGADFRLPLTAIWLLCMLAFAVTAVLLYSNIMELTVLRR